MGWQTRQDLGTRVTGSSLTNWGMDRPVQPASAMETLTKWRTLIGRILERKWRFYQIPNREDAVVTMRPHGDVMDSETLGRKQRRKL